MQDNKNTVYGRPVPTSNTVPVVNEHSPDASQQAVEATPSFGPGISVRTTALTRIPVSTTDMATAFVRPIIAAWLADRALRRARPCVPISEAIVTIRP